MKAIVLATALIVVAAPTLAQTPDPNCIAFVQEGTNGGETLCFPTNRSPALQGVLDQLIERDRIQAARHTRTHEECGDAGQFGMADTPTARACRARIEKEMPFPTPSEATVNVLSRHGLKWN